MDGYCARKDFQFFYRGDKICTQTQSKIFRDGTFQIENVLFKHWQENCCAKKLGVCDCKHKGSLLCLAYMQHYSKFGTRLLDFSRDPYVALRFACGKEGDNCRKKVTIYATKSFKLGDKSQEVEERMMELVNGDCERYSQNKYMAEDYFIEVDKTFPRIERQDGLFLFMGNRARLDDQRSTYSYKVTHELSPWIGRGNAKKYEGYVGVLNISPCAVAQIRDELDNWQDENGIRKYNIDYLMGNKSKTEEHCEKCPIAKTELKCGIKDAQNEKDKRL